MATARDIGTAAAGPRPVVGGAVFGLDSAALHLGGGDIAAAQAREWLASTGRDEVSRNRRQRAREWRARRKAEIAASFLVQDRATDIRDLDELARALGIGET